MPVSSASSEFLVEIVVESEAADLSDEEGEFLEVAFLLGSGERDGFGTLVGTVEVVVARAVAGLLVRVVVLRPDRDHVADKRLGTAAASLVEAYRSRGEADITQLQTRRFVETICCIAICPDS